MVTLDERAEELIENYALGHAGTAFTVGHLGGQFGADRIALTALTTKMINALCDLYGIHDTGARLTHIGSAIARLTFKGTVVAHTILNWIPIVGPGANSVTTYFLTKQAGQQCIKDIKNNRMTLLNQIGLALGRSALTFGGAAVASKISQAADFITDDVLLDVKTHSEVIASFLENHNEIESGLKYFLSHTIEGLGGAITNGQKPNVKNILENSFYSALISELCGLGAKHSECYVKNKDELLALVKSSGLRERLPGMSDYFDKLAIKYEGALNDQDVRDLVTDVAKKVSETLKYLRSSEKSDLEGVVHVIEAWEAQQA